LRERELEETYKATAPLVNELMANHQNAMDCIHAMRFLFKMSADTTNSAPSPFIDGIERLMQHVESLRRVAVSCHTAIGEAVRENTKTTP
jgi:hypothetical protein